MAVEEGQRVPIPGEYVQLWQQGVVGVGFFRVLLVATTYERRLENGSYSEGTITVQAEYVEGPEANSSDTHRAAIARYKSRGLTVPRVPSSGY